MPGVPIVSIPGMSGVAGVPFSESQNAGAGAQNTITLAARPKTRWVIAQIIVSTLQVTVVNGEVTVTNIAGAAGAATTMRFKLVESATNGGLLNLSFFPVPLIAFDFNQSVVVDIPAIGSGAATALTVIGVAASA